MDTRGSLKWIAVVFTIVAGFGFPVDLRHFTIHGDSDKSGHILELYGGRKEAFRAGYNTYFKVPGGYLKGLVKDEMEFQLRRMI